MIRIILYTCVSFNIASFGMLIAQTQADSAATAKPSTAQKTSDIDTTITYEAKIVDNVVIERKSYFIGDAVVNYKQMKLKAEKISIDWDVNILTAEGVPDTSWIKNNNGNDSSQVITIRGKPVLHDGDTEMHGNKMIYNYRTEKGIVVRGRTKFEDGNYIGQQIKRVSDKTFNVSHSTFTTCDLDTNPHYHFESRRLKMIVNERVIAKPVVMYIADIPVAALPFAFFPTKKGRHSGVLIPRYGESQREGRYLRGLGYYWAPNDYFDAKASIDFFEKSGWLLDGDVNYAIRYLLNGNISGAMTRKSFSGGYKARRWDLRVRHSQEIDPESRFSVNGIFISDKSFYRDLSTSLSTRLTRELRSNATYSKYWPEKKLSLSINASQVRDLEDNVTQTTFPQMSFRKSQTQIFKPVKDKVRSTSSRGRRSRADTKWYHSLYFSYGSNFYNSRREYLQKTATDTLVKAESKRQMDHNFDFSLNSPKKYFGWLSVNQSMNIQEGWFDKIQDYSLNTETSQIESREEKGFAARHTFSYRASANTKIYGLFTPKIADVQTVRHVITPSVSFTYQPDFSDPQWGYFQELKDASGKTIKRDRFGGTSSGGSKMISTRVRNLFQMKRGKGEKEKKVDLFTVDFSTGFNFKAKQYRLSDLGTYWQANPARNFSLSARTTHSFYAWDHEKKMRVHRYLFDDQGWRKGQFMRLTTFNLNFSIRLEGKGQTKPESRPTSTDDWEQEEADPLLDQELSILEEDIARKGGRFIDDRAISGLSIPWRLNMTFNFFLDKTRNPDSPTKRYYLDISGAEVRLTNKWRIGYSAHVDLEKKEVTYHRLTFYRDLHCWEAQVDWVPSGISKRVYFRINIKSPSLRDIKLERRGGTASSILSY